MIEIAYERLRAIYAIDKTLPPTNEFLAELYDETGSGHLQRYVTFYTAF